MSNQLPHTAKSVFFSCIDDRLSPAGAASIAGLPGGAFHPSMAGGGAAFLSDEDRPAALKQVVAAYKINGITDVYLQSHTDCGAYRLAGVTFETPEEELKRLQDDLTQAAKTVRQALHEAGAEDGSVTVHTEVVDPAGTSLASS